MSGIVTQRVVDMETTYVHCCVTRTLRHIDSQTTEYYSC